MSGVYMDLYKESFSMAWTHTGVDAEMPSDRVSAKPVSDFLPAKQQKLPFLLNWIKHNHHHGANSFI